MSYATKRSNRATAAILLTLLLTALLGTVGIPRADAVEQSSVIDFQAGLNPGDTVSTLSVGNGISGANLGTVSVFGTNPDLSGNSAMIFDATCGGQPGPFNDPGFDPTLCTGRMRISLHPRSVKDLIITEDGNASDPDDAGNPNTLL